LPSKVERDMLIEKLRSEIEFVCHSVSRETEAFSVGTDETVGFVIEPACCRCGVPQDIKDWLFGC
jgi:hypothetical protein